MVGSAVTHSALLLGRGLLEPIATGGLQRAAAPLVSALLCTSQRGGIWRFGSSALHSSAAAAAEGGAKEGEQAAAGEQAAGEQAAAEQAPQMSAEECAAALAEAREALEGEKKRAEELKDKLLRTLADMENLRERTSRLTAETKQFAVQGLVKNLLDVADNLERAAGSIPEADLAEGSEVDRDRALQLLRSLRDGVLMTDTVLMKVLAKEGVSRFDPMGEKFDPNLHNALFEVPDATKEPGTIAVVHKRGYMLNERVVRAAEVGVTRAQD